MIGLHEMYRNKYTNNKKSFNKDKDCSGRQRSFLNNVPIPITF